MVPVRSLALTLLFGLTAFAQPQVQTVAGGTLPNNVAGTSAFIGTPISVTADAAGNSYFGTGNAVYAANVPGPGGLGPAVFVSKCPTAVYRLDRAGQLTLIAGNGLSATVGDGGPATSASIEDPLSLAVDKTGSTLYIANQNRVRRVDLKTGFITTVAGTGSAGYNGDNQPATKATFAGISSVAVDSSGNLLIADGENNRVRRVDAFTGLITTVAGNGRFGATNEDSPATAAALDSVLSIATDRVDNLYIGTITSVLRVSSGTISPVSKSLQLVIGLASDSSGHIYALSRVNQPRFLNGYYAISRIDGSGGARIFVGSSSSYGFAGDNQSLDAALVRNPSAIAVDGAGNLFIADSNNSRIRRVDIGTATMQTVAGNGTAAADGAQAVNVPLLNPDGLAINNSGTLYFCEAGVAQLRRVDLASNILRTSVSTAPPDSRLPVPLILACGATALDAAGAIYFVDQDPAASFQSTVRHIPAAGGAPDTTASWSSTLSDVAFNPFGRLFASAIGIQSGAILQQQSGFGSNFTPLISPSEFSSILRGPSGIAFDKNGTLYIADTGNHRVVRVDPSTRELSTIAGTGTAGYTGDGGPAARAQLNAPSAVVVDPAGNLFIADSKNHAIRRVELNSGTIITLAGNGAAAFTPDGPASQNSFPSPRRLAFDPSGNLYVADATNRIRRITMAGAPRLTVDSSTLSFTGQAGAAPPPAQSIKVASSGAAVSFTATANLPWIAVTSSGQTGSALSISVNPAELTAGSYTGTVTLTSPAAFNNVTIAITFNVAASSLAVDQQSLAFSFKLGDPPPDPQTLAVTASQDASLAFTASVSVDTDAQWLQIDTTSATTPATIQVSVTSLDMLGPGTYRGTITLTAPAASPSSVSVAVQIEIIDPNLSP